MSTGKRVMLASMYQHFYAAAGRASGWHGTKLNGGARLDVKREHGMVRVCFSRIDKRLSDVELATFYAQCKIPASASRSPADLRDQRQATLSGPDAGKSQYFVIYSWRETTNE